MSCTHKLRGIFAKVGYVMSLVGGTGGEGSEQNGRGLITVNRIKSVLLGYIITRQVKTYDASRQSDTE